MTLNEEIAEAQGWWVGQAALDYPLTEDRVSKLLSIMTRSQYLGYLLFRPRDGSERFVQVLIWAIVLMVGGGMLWDSWNQYVVRGEAFTWDKDWKHWVEREGAGRW